MLVIFLLPEKITFFLIPIFSIEIPSEFFENNIENIEPAGFNDPHHSLPTGSTFHLYSLRQEALRIHWEGKWILNYNYVIQVIE